MHGLAVRVDRHNASRATCFPPFLFAQETSQLLEKYGGKFDYGDVDLDQVEGAGLDMATLAQLTTASL